MATSPIFLVFLVTSFNCFRHVQLYLSLIDKTCCLYHLLNKHSHILPAADSSTSVPTDLCNLLWCLGSQWEHQTKHKILYLYSLQVELVCPTSDPGWCSVVWVRLGSMNWWSPEHCGSRCPTQILDQGETWGVVPAVRQKKLVKSVKNHTKLQMIIILNHTHPITLFACLHFIKQFNFYIYYGLGICLPYFHHMGKLFSIISNNYNKYLCK